MVIIYDVYHWPKIILGVLNLLLLLCGFLLQVVSEGIEQEGIKCPISNTQGRWNKQEETRMKVEFVVWRDSSYTSGLQAVDGETS